MSSKQTLIVAAVIGLGLILVTNKARATTAAVTRPNGYTGTSSGVTIDPQGRWWFGGQIIYAPISEWRT